MCLKAIGARRYYLDENDKTFRNFAHMGEVLPPLTRQDVDACKHSNWYSRLKRISPKATIIPLTADFIEYLRRDGIFLPDSNGLTELDADSDEEDNQFSFPDLQVEIQSAIDKYGGIVFPKLNWSAPQDAEWMIANPALRCESPDDVYLLLKGSDFVVHDLEHAYEGCVDASDVNEEEFELVLKHWFDMPKSQEFRCFVRDKRLIAVSQRDPNFYAFLKEPATQVKILSRIQELFTSHILNEFPSTHYTFDVYLTRDLERVFLVDFNPYAEHTDALLFDWPTLHSIQATNPLLRIVEDELQASQALPRFSHNRFPTDVIHISQGKSIPEFAASWQAELASQFRPS